ncbi:MAG: hypothetical protein PHN51_11805 [Candidatus Nanopelagicales bacterium]|nr:hypothetical protein [Candidatus Nanopelagicales bacterium]
MSKINFTGKSLETLRALSDTAAMTRVTAGIKTDICLAMLDANPPKEKDKENIRCENNTVELLARLLSALETFNFASVKFPDLFVEMLNEKFCSSSGVTANVKDPSKIVMDLTHGNKLTIRLKNEEELKKVYRSSIIIEQNTDGNFQTQLQSGGRSETNFRTTAELAEWLLSYHRSVQRVPVGSVDEKQATVEDVVRTNIATRTSGAMPWPFAIPGFPVTTAAQCANAGFPRHRFGPYSL